MDCKAERMNKGLVMEGHITGEMGWEKRYVN